MAYGVWRMKNRLIAKLLAICLAVCCPAFPAAAQTGAGKPLAEYNSIVVEVVTLDKNPRMAELPAGLDSDLQKKIVADLRKKNVFAEVIDGTRQGGEAPPASVPAAGKRLALSTTIIDFNPGNKALRYTIVWTSLGAVKVKARFVFRDAATGREVLTITQQGKFWGFVTVHGTGKDYGANEASGDIVDGLIGAINKNR